MCDQLIDITQTLQVVCNAVAAAEATIREHIKKYYHGAKEEFITVLLHDHIKYRLREASEKNHIQAAFLEDLKSALSCDVICDWDLENELYSKSEGLIADIVLHNKRQEGKTGGDFGLIVVHPQIFADFDSLVIEKGRTSGLLCQAKSKDDCNKWRRLRKNQKAMLTLYHDFASLVLYSYLDQKRTELNPIAWKLCQGKNSPEIDQLLQKDDFGELLKTRDVIRLLGEERIGTVDQTLIDNVITPSSQQYFEIRIFWPKDNDLKETICICIQQQQITDEQVYVKTST